VKVVRNAIADAFAFGDLFDEPGRGPRLARKRVEQTGGCLGGARGLVQEVPQRDRDPREAHGRPGGWSCDRENVAALASQAVARLTVGERLKVRADRRVSESAEDGIGAPADVFRLARVAELVAQLAQERL
jgi:hypothetical protein